jgi:hypothetical protein
MNTFSTKNAHSKLHFLLKFTFFGRSSSIKSLFKIKTIKIDLNLCIFQDIMLEIIIKAI